MKRSEVNQLVREATACFVTNGWALPPNPHWDVTDFGLGDPAHFGLVLINLANEPEYCEKLMYARRGMTTPAHAHRVKKEDIICRWGVLRLQLWAGDRPVRVNGEPRSINDGQFVDLAAGERITLVPGVLHEFFPTSDACIIGEVSTANDDLNDNYFVNPAVGRFSPIDEDEPATVRLVSDFLSDSS